MADLSGRTVMVSKNDPVAAGACLQAAAVATGEKVSTLAAAWGLPESRLVEPNPDLDAEAIRAIGRSAQQRR